MEKLLKEKKMFSFSFLSKIKWGYYSANKTLLFFLITLICISILLGSSLNAAAVKINNVYLSKIYLEYIKPVSDFSSKYGIDSVVPKIRSLFLSAAKLENHSDWDNFYYMNTVTENETENSDSVFSAQTNKNEAARLSSDIALLEKKLDALKNVLNKLRIAEDRAKEEVLLQKELFIDEEKVRNKDIKEEEKIEVSVQEKKEEDGAETEIAENSLPPVTEIKEVKYTYTKEKPLRVLMIGDSQMRSIAGGFMRLTGENSSVKITEISVPSSGFIRGDYYNWPKKLKSVFAENKQTPFDITVIFLGMNDYQNFYGADGKILVKETPKWEEAYAEKIKKHLDILFANTKKIYWLGMPVVRNKVYNEDLNYIEKVQTKIALQYSNEQLVKFSLSAAAPGEGVPYTDTVQNSEGTKIKLMRDDGTHYTISGGEYIMKSFLTLLYKEWDLEPAGQ